LDKLNNKKIHYI